jgi:tetratricopeptide (TPR) repeat protein
MARDYYEQALQITREIGNRSGEGLVLGNLGLVVEALGDFVTARVNMEQALRIAREVGNRTQEANAAINLGTLAVSVEDYPAALAYAEQGLILARETNDQSALAWSLTCLGHARSELGQMSEAREAYQAALEIRRALGQPNLAIEPLAGLARLALASGDISTAKDHLEAILAHMDRGGTLEGTEQPIRVYSSCYLVLQAIQDPRAGAILKAAYDLLQVHASKIMDDELRRAFLEEVPYNREIMAAWKARREGTNSSDTG